MIYIIGTNHSVQVRRPAKLNADSDLDLEEIDALERQTIEAFSGYLENTVKLLEADAIAEEASEEFVAMHGHGASSVAKDIGSKSAIPHLFCDSNTAERKTLGLRTGPELVSYAKQVASTTGVDWCDVHREEVKKGFEVREDAWLEALMSLKPKYNLVIFLCGADHVGTFTATLASRGIPSRIHCRDWINEAGE